MDKKLRKQQPQLLINQGNKAENISAGWQGNLDLVYGENNGKTQLTHSEMRSPLKVQRPFYPEGSGVCHSIILHTAGGVVGGDLLSQNIYLSDNAHALITTPAAAKIYRSNGQEAKQIIQLHLEPDACLEWLPQETIIFNGAQYRQELRVELAAGATWLGWEITRFGRSARGEKFEQGEWRSHTEVWRQGQPLWIDRQWLPAREEILNSPHGLAGQPLVGSLVWFREPVSAEIIEQARSLWNAEKRQGEAGITSLNSGLLCRYRGASTSEVRGWFTQVWQLLRFSYLGRNAKKLRVW